MDIQMSSVESAQLNGTFTFFTSDNCQLDGVKSPDMVIDDSFPWQTEPFRVKLINGTNSDKLIFKNSIVV